MLAMDNRPDCKKYWQKYTEYAQNHFQNFICFFLIHSIPVPKFHENPPITFWVTLLTDKRGRKNYYPANLWGGSKTENNFSKLYRPTFNSYFVPIDSKSFSHRKMQVSRWDRRLIQSPAFLWTLRHLNASLLFWF